MGPGGGMRLETGTGTGVGMTSHIIRFAAWVAVNWKSGSSGLQVLHHQIKWSGRRLTSLVAPRCRDRVVRRMEAVNGSLEVN